MKKIDIETTFSKSVFLLTYLSVWPAFFPGYFLVVLDQILYPFVL